MRLLLDTNTVSYLLRGHPSVVDRAEEAALDQAEFLLASIVHYELARYLQLKNAERLSRSYTHVTRLWTRINLRFEDWSDAATLWAERHRTGQAVSDFDLLLAVLAQRQGATLVTSNTRHFEGLGVKLEDWMLRP